MRAPMWKLVIEDDEGKRTVVPLSREDYTIGIAERVGFKLVGRSELLANPKDTKDHPKGVWTLPPTLALGEQDRAKYQAIGEADNFLLKFQKPE